jgi:hypothetical protein
MSPDELTDAAMNIDAAVFAERLRIIGEREEDARRAMAGEPALVRSPIPPERMTFTTLAMAQLQSEAENDEAERTERLERRAVLQAEVDALRIRIAADSSPTSSPVSGARFVLGTSGRTNVADLLTKSLPMKGSFYNLIGFDEYLTKERSDTELEHSSMQVISKADRLKLSASDKSKIYTSFIKGTANKFKATSTIVGLDEISTIENITSFAELRLELQRHITSISVHPVFLILRFDQAGDLIDPDTPEGAPINLLSINSLPPLCDVEKSTLFHYKRGSLFNQENLVWSHDAVRNSCDKDLQSIIDAKMLKYKVSERFGPLYYYELVQQMTDVDSKAVRAITSELTSLKIPDLEGQSIANAASTIRSTLIWLEMVKMVPPDIDAIIYDILDTCTVPDFQLYLKTLITNASLMNLRVNHITLLEMAETQYRTLIISKKWDAAGPRGSVFQAQQHQARRTNNPPSGRAPSDRPRIALPIWNRTAPTDGEPHQRTHEDKLFKWCGTCGRWFFGDRAHLTAEHIPGHVRRRFTPNPPTETVPSTNAAIVETDPVVETPTGTATRNYMFTGGL